MLRGGGIVALVLTVAVVAWLFATREALIAMVPPRPGPIAIDQTGDWPDAPANSQFGTVNIRYRCSLRLAGLVPIIHTDLAVAMTAIFPFMAGPGQPFYVTDGHGSATLPAATVDQIRGLGIRQFSGRITRIDILALGGQPAARNAAAVAQPIPATRLLAGQPLTLTTPMTGRLTTGPFTGSGSAVEIGVGALRGELTARFAGGFLLPGTVTLDCPAPSPTDLVALITIGGASPATPAQVSGDLQPAALPLDSGLLGAIVPYSCGFAGYGTYVVPTNMTALIEQLSVRSGQRWAFYNGHGYVAIPRALTAALLARHPTATTALVTLTRLGTIAEDSAPADQNYLQQPVAADPVPLARDRAATAHFPGRGMLLAPEWFIAGSPGITRVYLGASSGRVQLRDGAGNDVGTPITFTCPTMHPLIPLMPFVVSAAQG